MKIKWKVAEKETGRYASFHKRPWPSARYYDKDCDKPCASILCEDEYRPHRVKEGKHAELKMMVAQYHPNGSWQWKTLTKRFKTLLEAKDGLLVFLAAHPEFIPEKYR